MMNDELVAPSSPAGIDVLCATNLHVSNGVNLVVLQRRRCFRAILIVLLLLEGVACKSPNILFILSDDTGWNDVSFHGSKQIPTPAMDELASAGNYAEQLLCEPCLLSHQGFLMSGRSMIHHGIQTPFSHGNDASNLSYTLFPEQLKKHYNYSTSWLESGI